MSTSGIPLELFYYCFLLLDFNFRYRLVFEYQLVSFTTNENLISTGVLRCN